jgi:parvulin-like peptidyl-prolyl isomerase
LRELFVLVPTTPGVKGAQPTFSAADDEAAKAKVEAARDRALKGEDFAKIVAEVSESGSKANGGLIGPVLVSELSEDLAKAIGGLKAGELTAPTRTARGYTLFKLESQSVKGVEPFDKVKDEVSQRILESRLDEEQAKHLQKLRAQALIEWKDETLRQMYEQALKNIK